MVYRRKDRPNEGYRVWPTLPGFGRVGPWQTGYSSKRKAEQVAAWLVEQALERPALIAGLLEKRYSLRDAWVAKQRGEHHLERLVAGHRDRALADAIEAFRPLCTDARARHGLTQLLELIPEGTFLSWLRESPEAKGQKPPRRVSQLYREAMEEGRKAASVKRSLGRAIRELLVHEFGEAEARARLHGLKVPAVADERDVQVTPDDLRALMEAMEVDRFRWMVLTAVLTTADRKPLLRLRTRDFQDEAATVAIHDTKTAHRARVVRLGELGRTVLRLATAGLGPTERVFPWTRWQVRSFWETARDEAAGRPSRTQRRHSGAADPVGEAAQQLLEAEGRVTLPVLRFKDLRHVLPTTLAAAGVDRREIQEILGHAPGSRMTDRYITPAGTVTALDAAAEALGLRTAFLRRAG